MFVFESNVQPLRDAQLAALAVMHELADGGGTDRAILAEATTLLLPTVFREMPKDTGTAAAAQTPFVGIDEGSIYTAPSAINPKSGKSAEYYLPFVFGKLDITPYEAAIREHGEQIPLIAIERINETMRVLL